MLGQVRLEPVEHVLKARDQPERRQIVRQLHLLLGAGALQPQVHAVVALTVGLAQGLQVEAADLAHRPGALLQGLLGQPQLAEQGATRHLALGVRLLAHHHREGIAPGADPHPQVLLDLRDPGARRADGRLGVTHVLGDGVLVVEVGGVQATQPRHLGLDPRLLHQALVARCQGLGHGELVGLAVHVLQPADRAVAGERRGDEPGLALQQLPGGRVHAAQRGIGVELDLLVLVALALDAALALLDVAGQPRHVEVVQGHQPLLRVHARAHGLGRAEQDADLAGVHVATISVRRSRNRSWLRISAAMTSILR